MDRKVETLRARSSAIIGVVAVAVSLVVSAPFVSSAAGSGLRGTEPAGLAVAAPAPEWIRLITGDQVAFDGGSLVAVRPGLGRGGIRLSVYRSDGHLYVVPADAAALAERGVVDRRLFDVSLLARPEYRRQNADGLAVIVTYAEPGARALVRSGGGVRVEHVYTSINGDGLRVGSVDAWRRLASATGVKRVWLDVVQDSLYS
ncbi:MAG: hypothetical protein QOH84_2086 [Kribbellaceae bacterium]|nr:hypothetical protein [Kribbellaceae bacterium]